MKLYVVSAQYVHMLNLTAINKTGNVLIRKHRGDFMQILLLCKSIKNHKF